MQTLKAPYCNLGLQEEEMNLHDDAFHIYSVREVFIECFRQISGMLRVLATQNNQLKYTLSFINGVSSKVIGPLALFSEHILKLFQETKICLIIFQMFLFKKYFNAHP